MAIGDWCRKRANEIITRRKPILGILNPGTEQMSMLHHGVEVYYAETYYNYSDLRKAIKLLESGDPPYIYTIVEDDADFPKQTWHIFVEDAYDGPL